MKIFIYILSCLFTLSFKLGYSQIDIDDYDPDIPRILIDWESFGVNYAKKNGYELINIIPQPCNTDNLDEIFNPKYGLPYLKDFKYYEVQDTLYIDYSVMANCCSNFVGSISYEDFDNDLLIRLYDYDGFCECNCCFNIQFVIRNLNKKDINGINFWPLLNGIWIEIEEENINE